MMFFSPIRFFQKGKSRTWLYDCDYCFVQVEFQPSAYSRGSFCNVGIAFLFEYFGGLNETLAFDFGRKRILSGKTDFIEYTGDDEIFETQVFHLANNAIKYAKRLMRFQSLKYGNQCMSSLIFSKWLKEFTVACKSNRDAVWRPDYEYKGVCYTVCEACATRCGVPCRWLSARHTLWLQGRWTDRCCR